MARLMLMLPLAWSLRMPLSMRSWIHTMNMPKATPQRMTQIMSQVVPFSAPRPPQPKPIMNPVMLWIERSCVASEWPSCEPSAPTWSAAWVSMWPWPPMLIATRRMRKNTVPRSAGTENQKAFPVKKASSMGAFRLRKKPSVRRESAAQSIAFPKVIGEMLLGIAGVGSVGRKCLSVRRLRR